MQIVKYSGIFYRKLLGIIDREKICHRSEVRGEIKMVVIHGTIE